ncbi:CID domain-containing protein [Heracleum sosnowskyi]|uniref:CID domain-containing protein n=1 Tax=Heracleum sosnowskyi TaxID=360622 RepID=A0AAD8H438_9APIA|nr:CID domain-containing protein [Heracleum sosnowskyi]
MGSTFKPHILVEKLVKLNSSQQSIETLSHWCIFHMNKAKNVVETWDKQFYCSPREQRLAFLYLANDILQNSRRKGSDFVSEFWKVLPDALHVVLKNGDNSERNAALRLINIWEERKVFGSQGQLLKEELVGKNLNIDNISGNPPGFKLPISGGNALDKITSAYQVLHGGQLDEEPILHKCMSAIRYIEKVDKEIGGGISSEQLIRSGTVEEIKGRQAVLMGCIKQLMDVQSCRTNIVSHLTEALREQESKLSHLQHQLQDAQSQSERAENLCQQIINNVHSRSEKTKESHNTSEAYQSVMDEVEVQTAPLMYTKQVPDNEKLLHTEENSKSAVDALAAPVTAFTSTAQVLPYALPSFASDGVIVNTVKGPSDGYPPEKKLKLENGHSVYLQSQDSQPPVPPYSHPDSLQHHVAITSKELTPKEQPPLPSSPPPMPPLPPSNPFPLPQFMPSAGLMASVPYNFGLIQQQPPPFPYPAIGSQHTGSSNFPAPPTMSFPNYQNAGTFYGQQSFPATPVSRQL